MATVTFWKLGSLKCILIVDGVTRELRLTDASRTLRSQLLLADDNAALIAESWRAGALDRARL
jgi:hypothetical protein